MAQTHRKTAAHAERRVVWFTKSSDYVSEQNQSLTPIFMRGRANPRPQA
jgi:hypothetical protein